MVNSSAGIIIIITRAERLRKHVWTTLLADPIQPWVPCGVRIMANKPILALVVRHYRRSLVVLGWQAD
jgi:hypothetical protein